MNIDTNSAESKIIYHELKINIDEKKSVYLKIPILENNDEAKQLSYIFSCALKMAMPESNGYIPI